MKTISFENLEDWMEARKKKITGSRLYKVVNLKKNKDGSVTPKKGYYELLAEKMALDVDWQVAGENAMDRGHRLEPEALEVYSKQIKKKISNALVIWVRDNDDNIGLSPDGIISKTEAVEVKCLNGATHLEILLTQKIPTGYLFQVYQYFIVNDDLKKLHVVFYNPSLKAKQLHTIIIKRSDIQEEIDTYLEYQRNMITEIDDIVARLLDEV